ncbi:MULTISPECIES: response regulator transcription factor [Arthrobacter]|uniref:response regulator n=1 Tax=Arthrobacter TaxID=1663 RepID=UPI0021056D73|nr:MULTISPECIES: response regulator transcription factor [Arthrobacter]MCQ1951960.1 response regulator transcription factor [Arthrobacter sp. zg-Y238]MCQ1955904.1 response regulator transcription factor [Arthrobacter jinronghuae]
MSEAAAGAGPITVALVDDQPLFRTGIQMLIRSQQDLAYCGSAGNGMEAVELAEAVCPDIMLMDLRMPVVDGITATRRIMAAADEAGRERPKVIALTTFNRDQAVVEAVRAGASGYLLKSAEPEFLLSAIRTVYAGYSVVAPGSAHDLFAHLTRSADPAEPDTAAIAELTAREKDVFLLVAKGLSNADIAGSVFLSEATVKTHIRRIQDRLGLATRISMVAFAYEHRLLG